MNLKPIILGLAGVLALSAPAAAFADPDDWGHDHWGHDRGWHNGWRKHEWRDHEWREREWREHRRWADRDDWRWGWDRPHCWIENRGYYNWYGEYVYRPVQACR